MTCAASLGILTATGGAAMAATPAAGIASPSTCHGVISINSFVFIPPHVLAGQSSAATLSATNCTSATQKVTETWFGRFEGPTPGIPAGCPAIDPFPRPVTFAPHASLTTATSYLVFSGCTATDLAVTVVITSSTGATLAQQTAVLQIG